MTVWIALFALFLVCVYAAATATQRDDDFDGMA